MTDGIELHQPTKSECLSPHEKVSPSAGTRALVERAGLDLSENSGPETPSFVARQRDGATVSQVAWGHARSIGDDVVMMVAGTGGVKWGGVGVWG